MTDLWEARPAHHLIGTANQHEVDAYANIFDQATGGIITMSVQKHHADQIVKDHNETEAMRAALERIGWHTEHGSSTAVIAAEVMVGLLVESVACPGCEHPKCQHKRD